MRDYIPVPARSFSRYTPHIFLLREFFPYTFFTKSLECAMANNTKTAINEQP